MTQSATVNSRGRSNNALANFDYAFNGVLDKAQVEELVTADFVGRAENVILVGGWATGKTVIAHGAFDAANARGLTTQYLSGPGGHMAAQQLAGFGPCYVGSSGARQGLRENLLNCDLLVVDEVERWLEVAPVLFMLLIGRRIELGKSNILVVTSSGWERLFGRESHLLPSYSMPEFVNYALAVECDQRSMFARLLKIDGITSVKELMEIVGIAFKLPTMAAEDAERQPSQPLQRSTRVRSPFAKAPVWHAVYTGENNYRDVLRRRCA
ncbi:MAG: ATP-binding protein [Candidatus Obscuribacterales bacterium]|jgi:hypothetical protein